MNGFNGTVRFKIARRLFFLLMLVGVLLGILVPAHAAKPNTIPAIQEWTDASTSGSFHLLPGSRVVLDSANAAALATTGQVFQSDLFALLGVTYPVVNGAQNSLQPGDIFLSLGSTDTGLGTEGYSMNVSDRIVISARADAGAFYGTRTLLQILKSGNAIPNGTARDYPRYPLRGLHVDNGRLFVTVDWLQNHIKELSYFKMNVFHWHLAEWNNFRFQSDTHPEVVAAQYYTKAQVKAMMTLATQYHVTIIPEFEMPGHMNWALGKHPELRVVNSSGVASADNIDLTNPASYTLINDLLNEWLPLIPGPYFHIGSDEYITDYTQYPQYTDYAQKHFTYAPDVSPNPKDVYFNFLNQVDAIVRSYSKTAWAWDDNKTGGTAFSLNKDFLLDSWTFAAQSEINQGFSLVNSAQASLYYVWYTDWQPMQTQLYQQWLPNQWTYTSSGSLPPYAAGLLGAKLELWFDNNQCEQYSMAWGMRNSMRTIAQQTWASPKIFSQYSDFTAFADKLGHAPGTTFPTTAPPITNPNGPYSAPLGSSINFSSAGTAARNGSIAKYSWSFGDGGTSTQANPQYTYKTAGNFQAQLIVTDSNGMTSGNQAQVTITSTTDPVTVSVSPSSVQLNQGATQAFTAAVTGTSNTKVTWSTTGGTINASGLYTAPSVANNYTVTATSAFDTTKSASATVTVMSNAPPGNNLALDKLTTASTVFSPTYAASMATDADPFNTRWCAINGTNGQWLLVDLGNVSTLTGTEVKWESNGVWQYKIETSIDGIQWQLAFERSTNKQNTISAQTYNDTFSAAARYVRITATQNQTGHWASIYDFEVFGIAS